MITEQKKRKINPMLMNVLLISGGLHVLVGLLLGGLVVVKYVIPDDAEFEEPPAVEEVEPPKEVKVEIKPQPTPDNQPLNNLRMKQVGNIAVSAVNVDLPSMDQSFTVSAGIGNFGGAGLLSRSSGSIGFGSSMVNVMGLKTKSERVLLVVDAGKNMLIDQKGGLYSYRVIKDEVTHVVSSLNAGTLFNVCFFDDGRVKMFKPQPIPTGTEVVNELRQWIGPINADAKKLGISGAKRPKLETLPEDPVNKQLSNHHWNGTNEKLFLTQAFLEQNIDAVFIITSSYSGFGRIVRSFTPEENAKWKEKTSDPKYQEQLKAYKAESSEVSKKVKAALSAYQAERKKNGLPPRIFDRENLEHFFKIKRTVGHPGYKPVKYMEQRDVEKYFKELIKTLYEERSGKNPSINIILFLAGDENFSEAREDNLKDFVRFFDGKYRIIRGENEIKSAATAPQSGKNKK
ncbi:hypothetical protein [Coraliomargarita parva]|uniref:hypothetical protein n=1 Tax=Coraliomargarita parva TaxID=3014050 RepID=UPI0022B44888|nr:hypothetical protein [Coraliomargarita parva]